MYLSESPMILLLKQGNRDFFCRISLHYQESPMTYKNQMRYVQKQLIIFRKHNITLTKQMVVVMCAVVFILYAVFFSNVPPIHDFFHELRHAMSIIPCH
jgi:hypothetical protein